MLLMVTALRISVPLLFWMPPPVKRAVLPLTVTFSSVMSNSLAMPPPPLAVLPLTVTPPGGVAAVPSLAVPLL